MKIGPALPLLLLTGCGSIDVVHKMPDGSELGLHERTLLKQVEDGTATVKDGNGLELTVGFKKSIGDVELVNAVGTQVVNGISKVGPLLANTNPNTNATPTKPAPPGPVTVK